MNDILKTAIGLAIPFAGTVLGAATVFLMKKSLGNVLQKALLGFASGVMLAASVWSLLIPSMDMAVEQGIPKWFPAVTGFLAGVASLLLLDWLIPHLHVNSDEPEGRRSSLDRSAMLVLAVTLHNIPEGMAVGVVFAGMLSGSASITSAGAFALAAGIAIQNFPEGAVISMPLVINGSSKKKAFAYGAMSGIVEPIGAVITIALTSLITPALPYILSFAAGAMIYVVADELIPEAQADEHSNLATVSVAVGFTLMLAIDVALG